MGGGRGPWGAPPSERQLGALRVRGAGEAGEGRRGWNVGGDHTAGPRGMRPACELPCPLIKGCRRYIIWLPSHTVQHPTLCTAPQNWTALVGSCASSPEVVMACKALFVMEVGGTGEGKLWKAVDDIYVIWPSLMARNIFVARGTLQGALCHGGG